MNHPNTKASVATTALAAGLVWLLRRYGYTLSSEWSLLGAGAVIATVLFVGRRGIKGTALAVWRGLGTTWNGKPAPKAK